MARERTWGVFLAAMVLSCGTPNRAFLGLDAAPSCSDASDIPTTIVFQSKLVGNTSNLGVWSVDVNCTEIAVDFLRAGASVEVKTFATRVFRVRDVNTKALVREVTATQEPLTVVIE